MVRQGFQQIHGVIGDGTITGTQSGLCLGVTKGSTADGAEIELWNCGGQNQQWALS